MTRNLKALGLALVVVFAMSAIGASGASAAAFDSAAEHTHIHATQTNVNVFGSTAGSVTCGKVTTTATITNSNLASISTSSMEFSECHIIILGSTVSATIATNGCNYKLYANGEADVVCPAGKEIEVKASGCTVKIGSQTGLKGISYSNNGNHVDISANITGGIKYSHSGFLCGTGSGTNGTYSGGVTVEGHENTQAGALVNLDYTA